MAEFVGKGWGALNTVLGSIGTAGATGVLGGLFNGNGGCSDNQYVNRYEANLENKISEKDMEIAYLKGQNATDVKILDLYKYVNGELNGIKREQADQRVFNATNTATIGCISNQVAQLMALTKVVIPNSSLCPGYGDVTVSITPTTPTT